MRETGKGGSSTGSSTRGRVRAEIIGIGTIPIDVHYRSERALLCCYRQKAGMGSGAGDYFAGEFGEGDALAGSALALGSV